MRKQHLLPSRRPAKETTGSKRPQFVSPQQLGQHYSESVKQPWLWITLVAWGGGLLLLVVTLVILLALSNLNLMTSAMAISDQPTVPTFGATTSTAIAAPLPPDIPALQQFMLTLINTDRRANGLSDLAWDNTAAIAGLRHAEEMAQFGYLSHWNLDGYDPKHRYALAGGLDNVRENVYVYQHRLGAGPTSPEQWQELIRYGQQLLMESSRHHDNILAAEHTHVGIGIAYEPATGWLTISQEFVDRYVVLQPLPHQASPDDIITVAGRLENHALNPLLTLAYEPLPKPMTVAQLKTSGTYLSAAKNYDTVPLTIDSHKQFKQNITLNHQDQVGLYHARIWVDSAFGKVLATDIIVKVQ